MVGKKTGQRGSEKRAREGEREEREARKKIGQHEEEGGGAWLTLGSHQVPRLVPACCCHCSGRLKRCNKYLPEVTCMLL